MGSAGERNVREYMINNGMVDCIVQMPDKLFLTTGIPACLFILSKNRDGKDSLHRERRNEILFIDARKLGRMVSRRLREFEDTDLQKIAHVYHTWRNNPGVHLPGLDAGVHEDFAGFCKTTTLDEVKANNYVLTPSRYVGSELEEDDGISFEEKMDKLTRELMRQFEENDKLEKQIRKNLMNIS